MVIEPKVGRLEFREADIKALEKEDGLSGLRYIRVEFVPEAVRKTAIYAVYAAYDTSEERDAVLKTASGQLDRYWREQAARK
ncbi:MAG: hypothetical protein ABIG68_02830 [Acidobacteriota bacterium]